MKRLTQTLLVSVSFVILLTSCHSVPKHAKFIPKDALFVLGVHTGDMRVKLAWSAITNSSLIAELRKGGEGVKASEAIKDIENAGINFGSTLYFYAKPDTRFQAGNCMAAIIPLDDAKKVTAYIQKHAPGIVIRKVGDRSEAMFEHKVIVGWNEDVLIAMNPIVSKTEHIAASIDDTLSEDQPTGMTGDNWTEEITDSNATMAALNAAFNPVKDGSITGNKRFKSLEKDGHDITMWVAYDAVMESLTAKADLGMMGMSMGNMLWKSSAMAVGFDFEQGRIEGEMLYYPSDSMRPVLKEFGKQHVDKDMLRRLPAAGLNFAAGYHLSPSALKMMLDKMGMSGIANLALMSKGLSVDDIFGAFTGDMVVAINNFKVETKVEEVDSASQVTFGMKPYPSTTPNMDFVYAIKIGDKAKVSRLMSAVMGTKMLQLTAPNTYSLSGSQGGATLVMGDKYIAAASNVKSAQAFLNAASGYMPDAVAKEISGHPAGMWADVRSFVDAAAPMAKNSLSDSAAYSSVRNMLSTFTANGGEFNRGGAAEYHMALNFTNKEENSLLQILGLAQRLSAASKKQEVAVR